ncbi:sensor histidine kinase [Halobellus rufus]|uniref:sensor histidine kinase n=1 Tax=Halobellus rufus TaxID=1448860 RepID=UPI00067916C4|nr:HAMP domain-containing sensor histidine kinase [Halobellus rufus]
MGLPDALRGGTTGVPWSPLVPIFLLAAGSLLLFVGSVRAGFALARGGPITVVLFDLLFVTIPGCILVYAGYWLPRSEIPSRFFGRILAWLLAGVLVMFGFILLRDLHPGVSAEWSVGTQAIALTLGSLGGLSIGVQETRARIRAEQLRERTNELESNERELKRQNERLEEFANVVSHDLRNPLNVATGRLTLARSAGEGDSEHLDHVARAHSRMEALIDDLLALARDGTDDVDTELIELDTVVQESWSTVDTADATLIIDVDRRIRADRNRVKQLLENLIRNAVEHGGRDVIVTVGELDGGFFVQDDGDGIDADRERIFETGYSSNQNGTGFGLSIVEQVADTHGWEVAVRDGPNGGARFEFTETDRTADD